MVKKITPIESDSCVGKLSLLAMRLVARHVDRGPQNV